MRILAPISYYGGKSKISHLYPPPTTDFIIEPFAGSAAYAWRHRKGRRVWLNDLDERTYSMWTFLTRPDALAIVEALVPETVEVGQKISEIIPADFPGLIEICRAEANQGTQGARGVHDQVTSMGRTCWKVKRKLREVIPEVRDWIITNVSYTEMINTKATWFIDPPYSNAAGRRYRTNRVNYEQLGGWCRSRHGQVIVCENLGADWLPFEPMNHPRVSIRSRYQKADAREVVYVQNAGIPYAPSSLASTSSPPVDVESQ